MSYILSDIKQIRFPAIYSPFGRFQVVINRPGETELELAATDTLLLSGVSNGTGRHSPFLEGDVELSKKKTTTRGRRALDDITLVIRDAEGYTGTVNGVNTSERFSPDFLTFLDVWFDESQPYKAFLIWRDAATGNFEVLQGGWIDPLYKPTSNPEVLNPGTPEEYWIGSRTVKITKMQFQATWQDVLNLITSADTIDARPYNGQMLAPPACGNRSNTRSNSFSTNVGDWYQGVPHIHLNRSESNPILVGLPAAVWPAAPWLSVGDPQQITYVRVNFSHPTSGDNYVVGDTGTINGGTTSATYKVLIIAATPGGHPELLEITSGGAGYSTGTDIGTVATSGVGTGLTVDIVTVGNGKLWGPSGNNFIQLFHLFEKIAEAQGFEAFDIASFESALDFFAQKADNTAQNWPIDTTALDLTDLYVSLNVFAKSHPYDGSYWDNPIGFNPETPIIDVLTGFCNFLLSDFNEEIDDTGASFLVTKAFGTPGPSLPSSWPVIGTPEESEPNTGPRVAHIKNKADELVIACPSGTVGDAAETEIVLRLHRIGNTSGANPINDKECFLLDTNKKLDEQADECFKVAWIDPAGVPALNPNVWKSLCYAFWLDATNTNVVYGSNWNPFPNSDGSAGSWNNSVYVVNACYKKGETPAANLVGAIRGNDYFNSRCYHAVAFAFLTLPLPTVRKYEYAGLSDDTGSIRNITTGITDVRRYGAVANQDWVGDELTQQLTAGTTQISWQAVSNSGAFPDITALPYAVTKGDSTGSSSGGGTTGSVQTDTGSFAWSTVTPVTLNANTDNWNIGSSFPMIALISSSADIELSGIVGTGGNFLYLHNIGSHFITLVNDATSTAPNRFKYADEQIDLAPLGTVLLWNDGTYWKDFSLK